MLTIILPRAPSKFSSSLWVSGDLFEDIVWTTAWVVEVRIKSLMITLFVHGFHILIGTAFLAVGFWRVYAYHSTDSHHLGLEAAILYWHFVDIVWLFLYVAFYYWGS